VTERNRLKRNKAEKNSPETEKTHEETFQLVIKINISSRKMFQFTEKQKKTNGMLERENDNISNKQF